MYELNYDMIRFVVIGNRREEDGMRVVVVKNLKNPYEGNLGGMNRRFKLTLNKLYAWSLVEYERVVMIDSDNIFLQNTDELFQCGQFCAVYINPCYFHTGLFVLQVCSQYNYLYKTSNYVLSCSKWYGPVELILQ
jgi:alpha-N-acetylglucosamine transferase